MGNVSDKNKKKWEEILKWYAKEPVFKSKRYSFKIRKKLQNWKSENLKIKKKN